MMKRIGQVIQNVRALIHLIGQGQPHRQASGVDAGEIQKFASDVTWVAIWQIFTSLQGLIALPVLAKSYDSQTYGIWAQIGVTVSLLAPILTLQFGISVIRFLASEEDTPARRRYLGSMFWAIMAFGGVLAIPTFVMARGISSFLFDTPAHTDFVWLTFLWAFFTAIFTFLGSYPRARGRIKWLSAIQAGLSVVSLVVMIAMALSGLGLVWMILCLVAIQGLFTLMMFGVIVRKIGLPTPSFAGLGGFLSFSGPQIPQGILFWIMAVSDRYFITLMLGLEKTGIYASSYTLGTLPYMFCVPINFVLFPSVTKYWEQKQPEKVRSYLEYSNKLFLMLAIPASVGIAMLSQPILRILTTSEYLAGRDLVFLIALGTLFQGVFQNNLNIVLLVKQTKWGALMIAVAAILKTGLNFALIPRVGIQGAAISTVVAYFALAVIVTVWARRVVRYKIDWIFLGKVVAATLIMALCLTFMSPHRALEIIPAIVAGTVVYGVSLLLLRAFSKDDKRIVKESVAGLLSNLR